MWLRSLIEDMRNALADDPSTVQSAFAALGTLVIVTETDVRTSPRSSGLDEPHVLGGRLRPRTAVPGELDSPWPGRGIYRRSRT